MNRRSPAPLFLALVASLLTFTTQAAKLPEKLRLLSCDLAGAVVQATSTNDVSPELKRLLDKADPDVVFLQHVADWESCERIAKLRPGLRVLTCSAFVSGNGSQGVASQRSGSQVAILARDKAILSWVDEISAGDGFAFALIQAGPRKIGVLSVQNDDSRRGSATERVLAEVKKLQQFANNRPDSLVIGGALFVQNALTEAGFETVASDAQVEFRSKADFWASNAGFLSRPRSLTISGIAAPALVTDIDTANTFPSKFAYQNTLLFPGESPAPIQAVIAPTQTPIIIQPLPAPHRQFPIGLTIAIIAVVLLALGLLFRRKATTGLVPLNDPNLPTNEIANDPVRLGLLTWFKTIFMQRLLADRRKMIADEAEATRRTLAIEQKLTELQISLQDRISAYETRIARLEKELSDTNFENRELIRLQIDELKEKIAKAKEEFGYRRN